MNSDRLGGKLVTEALTMLNGCGSTNEIIEKVMEMHNIPRERVEDLIKKAIKGGIEHGYLLEHRADDDENLSLASILSDKGHHRRRSRRRSRSQSRSRSRRSSRRRSRRRR